MTHTAELTRRGIADAATLAQWKPAQITANGATYDGWQYPVFRADGSAWDRPRWKNVNGSGPKYWWPKGKPESAKYYFLPGLRSAILKAKGVLYIAGGEPDVLAYHAAGIPNVLCWLAAEESVPDTLVSDLQYLGVSAVVYAPDRDGAGMRSAAKVYAALDDSGIAFMALALPYTVGSKKDVGDLWIDSRYDAINFRSRLHAEQIDVLDLKLYAKQTAASGDKAQIDVEAKVKLWRNEWIALVTAALGAPAKTGKYSYWHCPLGTHADNDPSFRISADQNPDFPWPVCSCGIEYDKKAWETLADALNVESWADFKRRKAQESGVSLGTRPLSTAPAPDADTPLWADSRVAIRQMLQTIQGDTMPEGSPIAFPFSTLHSFGGFAHWLWTGKTIGIGGISGGGKTMFLKSLCQVLLLNGYDVIWWGPEWTPQEYAIQDLQRAGGLTFEQINSLMVVRALMRDAKRAGRDMTFEQAIAESGIAVPTQETIDQSVALLKRMLQYPGRMFYIPDMRMEVSKVMQTAKQMTEVLRGEGRKVAAFVFDYAQLANLPGKRDWTWGKRVIAEIKAGVAPSEANLIGMVGIQSRKSDSEAVRQKGERLTMDAAQGTDEHPFNLYLTLTPEFREDGSKYPHGVVSIEKNSTGNTGQVRLHVKWSRLLVVDEIAVPTTIDLTPLDAGSGYAAAGREA